jgi:hypothetical protein
VNSISKGSYIFLHVEALMIRSGEVYPMLCIYIAIFVLRATIFSWNVQ